MLNGLRESLSHVRIKFSKLFIVKNKKKKNIVVSRSYIFNEKYN